MRGRLYTQLLSIATREHTAAEAEDVVQEALISAIAANRSDIESPENARWLMGVVRNRARMEARTARRRKGRETAWHATRTPNTETVDPKPSDILTGLPPALRTLAALVLTGHNRREIAYLLRLPDTALRQRVSALKRHLAAKSLATPEELTGLNLDLAYGRIRDVLLPALIRHGGVFASHDPDGHLFLIKRSQTDTPRQ